ncbi:hypothetical protein CC86DRAFT_385201 [Ophiobolus disseminans]|uniref:Uncharacterized protein n=1 Tax=Ophiobolus disseminans TaxID=1469910 RepID=A0A6A6ZQJ1_9PLEO|nr:hypothetical protein CC86DRAFT_385201 [Ophiobolus disseminans]
MAHHVIVRLRDISSLLQWMLNYSTDLPFATLTLEIQPNTLSQRAERNPSLKRLSAAREDVVRAALPDDPNEWINDLRAEHPWAHLAILLCMLVNLRDLRLGACMLHALPLCNALSFDHPRRKSDANDAMDWIRPRHWHPRYTSATLAARAPQLSSLTLPTEWLLPQRRLGARVADLRPFTSLRDLTAPYDALISSPSLNGVSGESAHLPVDVFPRKLERVTVLRAIVNEKLYGLVEALLDAKSAGVVVHLAEVEVYFDTYVASAGHLNRQRGIRVRAGETQVGVMVKFWYREKEIVLEKKRIDVQKKLLNQTSLHA